jgi:hypothetical protein
MELDKRQWYVRWFFWSLMLWDEFREDETSWQFENNGTNLCHFIRVILVWAPLVVVLHLLVYGSAIAVLTAWPIYLFGFSWYMAALLAIAIVVGAVWGTKRASRKAREWRRTHPITVLRPTFRRTKTVEAAPRGPGFFEVLWQYVVAVKSKVCPTITFAREQEVQ